MQLSLVPPPKEVPGPEFSSFWKAYPRRVAKAHAEKMWAKLSTEEKLCAIKSLPAHIKQWQQKGTEIDFIPHPGSWLNGKRFEDEISVGVVTLQAGCCKCAGSLSGGHTNTRDGKLCNGCWSAQYR